MVLGVPPSRNRLSCCTEHLPPLLTAGLRVVSASVHPSACLPYVSVVRYLPIACACATDPRGCEKSSEFNCNNPESTTGNRVVRQIQVEVAGTAGSYAMCNVENAKTCTYECQYLTRQPVPGVGNQAVCAGGE